MYRDKEFRVRPLDETLAHVAAAGEMLGPEVDKVFVADGDALVMDLDHCCRSSARAGMPFRDCGR